MRVPVCALFLLCCPLAASAEEPDAAPAAETAAEAPAPIGWSKRHPVSLGARAGVWGGDWVAPGLGLQIQIRPVRWLGLSLYGDLFAMVGSEVLRHDHVIGFSLYLPALIGNERWFLAPTLGACVDFRWLTPLDRDLPVNSDLLFGTHLGGMFEWMFARHWSLGVTADATLYVGNDASLDGWTASSSSDLKVSLVGQALTNVSLIF